MNKICFACQYPWRGQYSCELIQAALKSCGALPSSRSSEWARTRDPAAIPPRVYRQLFFALTQVFSWALQEWLRKRALKKKRQTSFSSQAAHPTWCSACLEKARGTQPGARQRHPEGVQGVPNTRRPIRMVLLICNCHLHTADIYNACLWWHLWCCWHTTTFVKCVSTGTGNSKKLASKYTYHFFWP